MATPVASTKTRVGVQGVVSSAVGFASAWVVAKWGSLHAGWLAALTPAFTTAYYVVISFLEKKFPKLLWLFGQLPQKPTPVVVVPPTPAPTPTPTPAPASKYAAKGKK